VRDPEELGRYITTLAHGAFGEPECCGCLNGIIRGHQADIICNECDAVVRSVTVDQLARTLVDMELEEDAATAMCPHSGAVNLFPRFSETLPPYGVRSSVRGLVWTKRCILREENGCRELDSERTQRDLVFKHCERSRNGPEGWSRPDSTSSSSISAYLRSKMQNAAPVSSFAKSRPIVSEEIT
jgi:hypothetical protein